MQVFSHASPNTSPLISIAFLTVFLAGAALGYKWRDNTARLHEAEEQRRYTQVLNSALEAARKREQALTTQIEVITRDTEKQLQDLAAAERAAFDSRLRELAQEYAGLRPAGTHSTATTSCEAADANRLAGLACEKAYEAVRTGQN